MSTRQVVGRHRDVPTKQERGQRRRAALISAARNLMREHDPQLISFRQIAATADVPESSAYYFFANKYDLFSAVAIEVGAEISTEVSRPVDTTGITNWKALIAKIAARTARYYKSDTVVQKVFFDPRMPAEIRMADRDNMNRFIDSMIDQFHNLFEFEDDFGLRNRLVQSLTLHDALVALEMSETGQITDNALSDGLLAMTGYLDQFMPNSMALKNNKKDDQ
jgi:AcrR family transcriptional regulator